MAWLVRIRLTDLSPAQEREFARCTYEVNRRFPDVLANAKLHSRVETRRLMKETGLPSSLPEMPDVLYSMDLPEEVIGVVARYGGKLGKALHYRHTRRIVSTSAAVDSRVFTNLNALGSAFPRAALSLLQNEVEIQRAPTSLKSQFDYRFAVVEEGESSGFVISFGESLVLVVLIFLDRVRFEATQAAKKNSEQMQTTGVA